MHLNQSNLACFEFPKPVASFFLYSDLQHFEYCIYTQTSLCSQFANCSKLLEPNSIERREREEKVSFIIQCMYMFCSPMNIVLFNYILFYLVILKLISPIEELLIRWFFFFLGEGSSSRFTSRNVICYVNYLYNYYLNEPHSVSLLILNE